MSFGPVDGYYKTSLSYVWPVRGGQQRLFGVFDTLAVQAATPLLWPEAKGTDNIASAVIPVKALLKPVA